MMTNKGKWLFSLFISLFLLLGQPGFIFAHSALLEAFPSINSHLEQAPTEIRLKFNERLEKELYYIHVFNEQGKLVTDAETKISQDQTELHLGLPPLSDGNYTVSYYVISADGHPISQAYVISVGNTMGKYDPKGYAASSHQENPLSWFIRILYYSTLLAFCGLILWKNLFPVNKEESIRLFHLWFKYAKRSCFAMLILLGIVQFIRVWKEFGIKDIPASFFYTTSGQAWCISLVLITISSYLLGRRKWFDLVYVLLLLIAKGINGHAVTFDPIWLSVFLDTLHLAAASVWAGGLLYLIMVWKELKLRTPYLQLFSKHAFWSIITLVLTGILLTVIFLPAWSFLFHTQWGILLIIKCSLVVGVVVVAALVRRNMSKRDEVKLKFWLKWDYGLLSLIIFIVSGLTYTSPIPANDPFIWSERQNTSLLNMEITPNNPGVNNTFNITVELPKEKRVKNIELQLKYLGEQNIAPMSIPLKNLPNSVPDLNRYSYSSVGPFISIPGRWMVEVTVMDQDDNWTQYKKEMTIYPVKRNK